MPTLPMSDIAAIRRIAAEHGIQCVSLFGSRARGDAHATSDVDLLIRLLPGHGFSDFMAFCEEAEAALGRRVDVVTEDGLSPYIRARILAEAVPL